MKKEYYIPTIEIVAVNTALMQEGLSGSKGTVPGKTAPKHWERAF